MSESSVGPDRYSLSSMRRAVLVLGIVAGVGLAGLLWLSHSQPAGRVPGSAEVADEAGRAKVDLNEASREELLRLPGMSPALADGIIQHRPYRKLDDLVTRKVLGKKEFARIREHIAVGRAS
jgi:DNA uptake protein ComE-like DNA-binding protein